MEQKTAAPWLIALYQFVVAGVLAPSVAKAVIPSGIAIYLQPVILAVILSTILSIVAIFLAGKYFAAFLGKRYRVGDPGRVAALAVAYPIGLMILALVASTFVAGPEALLGFFGLLLALSPDLALVILVGGALQLLTLYFVTKRYLARPSAPETAAPAVPAQ